MWRYALTIFLSAFLLFLLQPLIGNYILPWFGGGAGIWTACMLFFQVALLAGYSYAHLVAVQFSPKTQMWVHIAMLIAAVAFLPIIPDSAWKAATQENPTWQILLLLTATIGLPFVMLSTTGPLMQAWFSRTHPGRSPYRLYALSNAGSLLALLCYPFAIEPFMTRQAQAMMWSGGFVIFAALAAWCAVMARREAGSEETLVTIQQQSLPNPDRSSVKQYALWLLLPACAVVMLLAVTSHLSEEVAPAPFLWVSTLGVYLLTFIICFEWPRLYQRSVFVPAVLLTPLIVLILLLQNYVELGWQLAAYLLVTFVCCMVCHGELHRLRPEPRRLTAYYLCIAAGGALGGAFVSIIAPLIFNRNIEFYLAMYGSIALLITCMTVDRTSHFYRGSHRLGLLVMILVSLVVGYLLQLRISETGKDVLVRDRSFYGNLELRITPGKDDELLQFRHITHGRISHGGQHFHPQKPMLRMVPTTYYGPVSGVGIVLREYMQGSPRRVGLVGLGAGSLLAYAMPGDTFRFYEINPQVEAFAEDYFTFLADARVRGVNVEVVINDARLALEQEPPQQFDVLVLDAFSGDAIPIHLLTLEAFEIYARHLAEGGVLLVHISNRYLDLRGIVNRLADHLEYETVFIHSPDDDVNLLSEALWVMVTRNEGVLNSQSVKDLGNRPRGTIDAPLWTDESRSIFSALRKLPLYR